MYQLLYSGRSPVYVSATCGWRIEADERNGLRPWLPIGVVMVELPGKASERGCYPTCDNCSSQLRCLAYFSTPGGAPGASYDAC